jgi:hypothetical protein
MQTFVTIVVLLGLIALLLAQRSAPPSSSPTVAPRQFVSEPGSVKSQRDMMRELARRLGTREAIIAAYADAERAGSVQRMSNDYNLNPEEYARRLYADGVKKGWLEG